MSEQTLRDRLAALVDQPPPMQSGSADDVRRGRSRLRTRRALGVAAGTVAVAAVAAGGVLVREAALPARTAAGHFASGEPGIVERCTRVDNGALDPTTFRPGSRVLVSQTSPSGDVAAVVVSADETTWASCLLFHERDAEFNGTASAYRMTVGRAGVGAQETAGMGYGRGHFWYVDRFPSDVARVVVRLDRDHTVTAKAVDGFVAFAVDDRWLDMSARVDGSVTLESADGSVLSSPSMTKGDASVVPAYRSLVPMKPLPFGGAER